LRIDRLSADNEKEEERRTGDSVKDCMGEHPFDRKPDHSKKGLAPCQFIDKKKKKNP